MFLCKWDFPKFLDLYLAYFIEFRFRSLNILSPSFSILSLMNCVSFSTTFIILEGHRAFCLFYNGLYHMTSPYLVPRTTDAQWSLFSLKPQTFGLCRQFGQINFGAFGVFLAHIGTMSPLSMFSINQPLFLQKTKPLYPNPEYLSGIGIWIWAAKN